MAITYVGSNTGFNINGANVTISLPAMVQNDLVLVFTGCQDESEGGPPSTSGYTAIADILNTVSNLRLHVSRKLMGAVPDPSVTIPGTGLATTGLVAAALVFRGVHTATPLDVTVVSDDNPGSAVPNAPAITPTSNDCCIVIGAAGALIDTSVGSVTSYLPSPSVQITADASGTAGDCTLAASYRIMSGGASVAEDPLAWSTWGVARWNAVTIALRPVSASVELITVTKATVSFARKTVAVLETTPVSKYRMIYSGKTINTPDGLVENIFVDKYRIIYTSKTVEPLDIIRSVTVTKASVLYRGRTVTPREIQFEDIPRYAVKGRGSGHWMETR